MNIDWGYEMIRRAKAAIRAYNDATGQDYTDGAPMSSADTEEVQDLITDMITDLRHYCMERNIDWSYIMKISQQHFIEEALKPKDELITKIQNDLPSVIISHYEEPADGISQEIQDANLWISRNPWVKDILNDMEDENNVRNN
jgi:hypothetical protein